MILDSLALRNIVDTRAAAALQARSAPWPRSGDALRSPSDTPAARPSSVQASIRSFSIASAVLASALVLVRRNFTLSPVPGGNGGGGGLPNLSSSP